jgi:hypothetical protein
MRLDRLHRACSFIFTLIFIFSLVQVPPAQAPRLVQASDRLIDFPDVPQER